MTIWSRGYWRWTCRRRWVAIHPWIYVSNLRWWATYSLWLVCQLSIPPPQPHHQQIARRTEEEQQQTDRVRVEREQLLWRRSANSFAGLRRRTRDRDRGSLSSLHRNNNRNSYNSSVIRWRVAATRRRWQLKSLASSFSYERTLSVVATLIAFSPQKKPGQSMAIS